ncbi:hypothetical protein BV898_00118 [Hypsibius exemplaris]|uniref:Uncharacterized protein n=1 Tax=Hypsibius exemplaris TaxID=2072580 RepID=A0A1W0XF46_HYPEX|nr:hypothetical protein BV898_00118 [Hypsibius exemplaris]
MNAVHVALSVLCAVALLVNPLYANEQVAAHQPEHDPLTEQVSTHGPDSTGHPSHLVVTEENTTVPVIVHIVSSETTKLPMPSMPLNQTDSTIPTTQAKITAATAMVGDPTTTSANSSDPVVVLPKQKTDPNSHVPVEAPAPHGLYSIGVVAVWAIGGVVIGTVVGVVAGLMLWRRRRSNGFAYTP